MKTKLDSTKFKQISLLILLLFVIWIFIFIIGSFTKIIPCYTEADNTWYKCEMNGFNISKIGTIYFNNIYFELIYIALYNFALPIVLLLFILKLYKNIKNVK